MSHRIEYQWAAFRVPAARTGLPDDRFVIAVEGGDNNCYDDRGRRSRSWSVTMLGTAAEVLGQGVRYAGACEGGGLKPHNKDCSPEAYIRRVRRLLEDASETPMDGRGHWSARVRLTADEVAAEIAGLGIATTHERSWNGTQIPVARFGTDGLADYFRLAERFCRVGGPCAAWDFAEVNGLPAS